MASGHNADSGTLPTLVGLVLLLVTYAEFIAMFGTHCIRHQESAALYQNTGTGVLLALPMAIYWMMVKLAAREPAPRLPGRQLQ